MGRQDVQTNLTIAMQTKGFDKGMRQMLGVSQKVLEGLKKQSTEYGKAQKTTDGMRDKLQDLAKQQLKSSKALEQITDKTGAAYKFQAEQMKRAQDQARKLNSEMKLLEKSHLRDAEATQKLTRAQREMLTLQKQGQQQSRWAMTQGIMQGAGMGGMAGLFMQRGPGFVRQFAGQRIGGVLRRAGGFARGMAQAPFAGIGGLQQALSALPLGGIAAGQLGAMQQHAQASLGWERARLAIAPTIETRTSGAMQGQLTGIDKQIDALRGKRKALSGPRALAEAMPTTRAGQPRSRRGLFGWVMGAPKRYGSVGTFQTTEEKKEDVRGQARTMINTEEKKLKTQERALQVERQRLWAETPTGRLQAAGRRYAGLSRQEAAQQAAQMFQTSGGRYTGTGAQARQVGATFAAQTMYGVGPQAAGAFGLAGRRGGLVGGRGRGTDALAEALQDAISLGLEGSEITQYIEQMAQGIQQFQMTGIPINKESIKTMAIGFSEAGIGAGRGRQMAGGIQRYVQNIGQRGVSGGLDLILMQAFGGFTGQGGAAGYEQAIMKMTMATQAGAEGITAKSPMGQIVRKLVSEGGGVKGGGITLMQQQLGQIIPMSPFEARAITARAFGMDVGEVLTKAQAEAGGIDIPGERRRRLRGHVAGVAGGMVSAMGGGMGPAATQQLLDQAAGRVGGVAPHVRTAADLANQQLDIGRKSISAVMKLEKTSRQLNDTFATVAAPALKAVSTGLHDFAKALDAWSKGKGSLLSLLGIGSGGG